MQTKMEIVAKVAETSDNLKYTHLSNAKEYHVA